MISMTKGKIYKLELLNNGRQSVEYLGDETASIIVDYLEKLEEYAFTQDYEIESIQVKKISGPANPPNDNFCRCKFYRIELTIWDPVLEKNETEQTYVCFGNEAEYFF